MFPKAGRGRKTSPNAVHCVENVRSGEWRTFFFLILSFLGVYNLLGSVVKPQSSNSLKATTAHGMVAEHMSGFENIIRESLVLVCDIWVLNRFGYIFA